MPRLQPRNATWRPSKYWAHRVKATAIITNIHVWYVWFIDDFCKRFFFFCQVTFLGGSAWNPYAFPSTSSNSATRWYKSWALVFYSSAGRASEDVSFSCWNRPCWSASVSNCGSHKRTTRSVHRIFISWPWNTQVFTTSNHKMPASSLDVQMASIDASTQILDQAGLNGGGVLNDCWYLILNDDICWYYLMFRCSGSISLPSIGFRIMNHADRHQWSGAKVC